MKSAKEVAAKLGMDVVVVYGLLHFMKESGLVETGKEAKVEGKRGKSATTYSFDRASVDKLHQYLLGFCDVAVGGSCAIPVNAPAEVVSKS